MKLHGEFYTLREVTEKENGFSAEIDLQKKHLIYEGHFPNQPVTPGVIQLKIVHELLEHFLKRKLQLVSMSHCKFLKAINPNLISSISLSVNLLESESELKVNAQSKYGNEILFKMSAVYHQKKTLPLEL
ncbi:MAG: 3-hydroxyacyl-ACP dehydratase [Bacteroidetes bacterium]|nr:3-hydroxyacyl-ACP dehydratase [Bacteroidota bacterium]